MDVFHWKLSLFRTNILIALEKGLIVRHSQSFTLVLYIVNTNVDSDCYAVMSNHAVIKIYNILISDDDIEVIVEVFEVQDNFLSYPFLSEIWHIYKLSDTMAAVIIVLQMWSVCYCYSSERSTVFTFHCYTVSIAIWSLSVFMLDVCMSQLCWCLLANCMSDFINLTAEKFVTVICFS